MLTVISGGAGGTGGVCFEIDRFLKSLTKVTVNRFFNTIYFKGSNVSLILPRKNRICLDGVDFVIVLE